MGDFDRLPLEAIYPPPSRAASQPLAQGDNLMVGTLLMWPRHEERPSLPIVHHTCGGHRRTVTGRAVREAGVKPGSRLSLA